MERHGDDEQDDSDKKAEIKSPSGRVRVLAVKEDLDAVVVVPSSLRAWRRHKPSTSHRQLPGGSVLPRRPALSWWTEVQS